MGRCQLFGMLTASWIAKNPSFDAVLLHFHSNGRKAINHLWLKVSSLHFFLKTLVMGAAELICLIISPPQGPISHCPSLCSPMKQGWCAEAQRAGRLDAREENHSKIKAAGWVLCPGFCPAVPHAEGPRVGLSGKTLTARCSLQNTTTY